MKLYFVIFLAICILQCIRAPPPPPGGGGNGVNGTGAPSCPIDLKRLRVKCVLKTYCNDNSDCGVTDDGVTKICCVWNCAQQCINPNAPEYAAGYAALAELDGK